MEILARHPRKGDCIVRECTQLLGRVKVLVDYPDLGLCRRPEYLDELVSRDTGKPFSLDSAPPSSQQPKASPPSVPTWQSTRQTIVALRLGQSTPESVRLLSVGMDDVDAACKWAIDRAATGQLTFLLFESPYGMGKSHALNYLRLRARERTMAIGGAVLDGVGVSLCLPMSLVSSLTHAIEFPDDANSDGLPARLGRLIPTRAVDVLATQGCDHLHAVLKRIDTSVAENPDEWEIIEDFLSLEVGAGVVRSELGLVVPALKARLIERPYRCAELLREYAQACVATGARAGLAILLDEADVDYAQSGRTETERAQRESLFRAWREIADVGPTGSGYARLVIAIAMTPGAGKSDPVSELKQSLGEHLRVVRLPELSMNDLRELGKRVCKLYLTAYQISPTEIAATDRIAETCLSWIERSAEGRNPRRFLRLLLEKLDAAYL